MRVVLYPHGGSGNHGCEALVRSTAKITEADVTLFSTSIGEDKKYGLPNVVSVKTQYNHIDSMSVSYPIAWVRNRLFKDSQAFDKLALKDFIALAKKSDVALSIGGDNYCYGVPEHIIYMNRCLAAAGVPMILWGCSIDPEAITGKTLDDLERYEHIIVRESLTADALRTKGFENVTLLPDPAFQLDAIGHPLPDGWADGNTVGINISPMVMGLDRGADMALRNYERLVEYIVNGTDMTVALIPHVVWWHNDDRKPLTYLYEKFKSSGRVLIIDDCGAESLKGYIARCRFMVAARTHASIAAYSSQVPTVVVGYSVKAKGIAKDLFGSYEHYVCPVQLLADEEELTTAFKWLMANENSIRNHYQEFMPGYVSKAMEMKSVVERIIKTKTI